MNKFRISNRIVAIILFLSTSIFPNGNMSNFELGTAMYRKLAQGVVYRNHWHTGNFDYFQYYPGSHRGYMFYSEAQGVNHPTSNKSKDVSVFVSNYPVALSTLKTSIIDYFRDGETYYGTYSRAILPNTRASITSTAIAVGNKHIEYTWQDMLIPVFPWWALWDGTIDRIEELRCDGVVEYCHEKNGVTVSRVLSSNGSYLYQKNNIAEAYSDNFIYHNDLHTYGYDFGEMCPKIQSGEGHGGSSDIVSWFSPLESAEPITSDFQKTQYSNKIQLSFKIRDNASVKVYVLIQVKKASENTWHILEDENNNIWKFKEIDLTEWYGWQYDFLHIPWIGEYENGNYPCGINNFDLKVTVIDQGANYSDTPFSFSADVPEGSAIVSPLTNNVGSIKGDTPISGSFTINNTGSRRLYLEIINNNGIDLDPTTPNVIDNILYQTIASNCSSTIHYGGTIFASFGPFTESIIIQDNSNNIHETHNIIGTMRLPDYCYGETKAMASSPEEQLFDKEFIEYFALSNDSLNINKDKSLKEKLSFAYRLLKQSETVSVDNICKMIIELYPESEMGISFYAMGLLWEASLSKEAPEFGEKEFKNYLKELTERKLKYKINGYAQLILSLLDVGKDVKGLEKLFSDYEYDGLKELALFHQFIHYYIYKQDKETARKISDQLDKMFVDSRYGYQAHLIFGDNGYTLDGIKELIKKKQESLLAKQGESKNDILSEMPKEYKLFNNYPNPFNPTTTIKYSVPKVSNVKLTVYNMMGQLIKTLVSETKAPGFYNVEWNGTNENNSSVASGIYFYRFESDSFIANNKMILIK